MDQKTMELLTERIVDNTEIINEKILKIIGESIKQIKDLTPTQAQQLQQILKYGTSFNKILDEISKVSGMNKRDIKAIMKAVAEDNIEFSNEFFKYRNMPTVKYQNNKMLKDLVEAYSRITTEGIDNLIRSKMIGYSIKDETGKIIFSDIRSVYDNAINKAVLSIMQGKSTFDKEMYDMLKQIGQSGLKTVDYESGRTLRMDSAIRMQMMGQMRDLTNEIQNQFGESYGADGIEVSVHENPAPDHEEVQGRQFKKEEFDKFQNNQDSHDLKGNLYTANFGKYDRRSISQYNCYHYTFNIIVGVSKPLYTDEQLNDIKRANREGFVLDGRHYTNYQGTQLQRTLERKIREQKDVQILARKSDNKQLAKDAQTKINQLVNKYKELSDVSGLPTKLDRLRVPGYRKIKDNVDEKTHNEEKRK